MHFLYPYFLLLRSNAERLGQAFRAATAAWNSLHPDVRPLFLFLRQRHNAETEQDCPSDGIGSTYVNAQVHQVHQQENETTDREKNWENRFEFAHQH